MSVTRRPGTPSSSRAIRARATWRCDSARAAARWPSRPSSAGRRVWKVSSPWNRAGRRPGARRSMVAVEVQMSHSKAASGVRIKRAYEPPSSHDGTRVLVDRLWPRGVKKADAGISQWMKEIAPSNELRKWFGHDPQRWQEFRRRYKAELAKKRELLGELRNLAKEGPLTLVYAAHDEVHNQAAVLREMLLH